MHRLIALAVFVLPIALHAQGWPPPYPQGGDGRIYIEEIREDGVSVGVPYNYGQEAMHEWEFLNEWANWACGLYQRRAVSYSFRVSDPACDEMGRVAAERSGQCWHIHNFACAIPPNPP